MTYIKQIWNNGASGSTPINAERLRHMEEGIENASSGYDVASMATGGTGSLAFPWTGWETSLISIPSYSSINFREGYYVFSATFLSGQPGWKITGIGATITVASGVELAAAIFLFTNCHDVEVSDITFDLNKSGTPAIVGDLNQAALYFLSANVAGTTAKVRNVTVLNGHDNGIVAYSSAPGTNTLEFEIHNSKITGCDRNGIYAKGLTDGLVFNCESGNHGVSGVSIDASSYFDILGGDFNNNGWQGITISASSGCSDFSLIGTTTNDNDTVDQGGGITLSIGSTRFRVIGCTGLRNYFYGMTVDPREIASDDMELANGVISGCTFGDSVRPVSGHGININYATHVTITGNILSGNPGSGIALSGGNCIVNSNVLRNNGVAGISLNHDGISIPNMGSHTIGVNHYDGNGLKITGNGAALTTSQYLGGEFPAGGNWTTATLSAGWSAMGSVTVPRYRRVGDRVFIEGAVQNTSGGSLGTTVFTLPAGYRPLNTVFGNYPSGVFVNSAGVVSPNTAVVIAGILSVKTSFSIL